MADLTHLHVMHEFGETEDLTPLAKYLRRESAPDPLLVRWLADLIDPTTTTAVKLIVKRAKAGRPSETAKGYEIGKCVYDWLQDQPEELQKLEAAIHFAMSRFGGSVSSARRHYLSYVEALNAHEKANSE